MWIDTFVLDLDAKMWKSNKNALKLRTWMSIEYICDNGMDPIVHFGAWYCRKDNAKFYNGALGRVCCAQGKWQANLVKMIPHTVGTTVHTVYSHRYNDEPQ